MRGGVACELVHLGSLYHDDVMDEATTRRGVDTVNAKWGNLQAILAGDFLLSRASGIAASLGTEIAGLLARTIGWLCEGQIEELRHTYDTGRVEASYFTSIQGKTASLFGTAARIGGIVAGSDRGLVEALTEYGNSYGMVFQIVDDILDVTATEDQLGKPAGHDMVEGVYTLPVLRTLAARPVGLRGARATCSAGRSTWSSATRRWRSSAPTRASRARSRRPASTSTPPRRCATGSRTARRPRRCGPRPRRCSAPCCIRTAG